MFAIDNTVDNGESILGRYNVEVARWSLDKHDWMPTMPPLYASLTEKRLILQTQTRKQYDPAIIPLQHIKKISTDIDLYNRRIVILHLKSGHLISLYTSRKHIGKDFLAHLRLLTMPGPVVFDPQLHPFNLKRLIQFVKRL